MKHKSKGNNKGNGNAKRKHNLDQNYPQQTFRGTNGSVFAILFWVMRNELKLKGETNHEDVTF